MNFSYYMPTRILFGKGQLDALHTQPLPGKKALIVTTAGTSVKRYGYLQRLTDQLRLAQVEHVLFDVVLPNPIHAHVMEGAKLARDSQCDFVIGLGGGSSIDSAKSIAVMATNPGDYWDYVGGGSGKGKTVAVPPLPIVAITTTAGTGTEADPWTVITKGQEKIGFGCDGTFPVLSVVDPGLMVTVPPHLTAYQGFDALFHSTEGFVNRTANAMSDLFALEAIRLIGSNLPQAVRDGTDENARANVALANTLSGIVESTSGCISEHSIEHALSAYHPKLPHGAGLIMISRAYYTFLAASGSCDARMVDMARALGQTDATKPMDFVESLLRLQAQCGVDSLHLSEYGVLPTELSAIAHNARETMTGLFRVDPCEIRHEDVVTILTQSYR